MQNNTSQIKHALIAALVAERGALAFRRRLAQAREARPGADWVQLLAGLLEPDADADDLVVQALARDKIRFTTVLDDAYPLMLKHIADPPPALFYAGELRALHRPCIAIVGSRACTHYGLQTTKKIAGELAVMGFTVVSGLALGIDARAHEAALEVCGRTVGVLASGVDHIYPKENRDLARHMVRDGAVISEFGPSTPPKPFHFPIRNRIISGLAHATIVIEAKQRSGSLITARHCLDQGRELFALPGPIHHATSLGTNGLIAKGEARPLLTVGSVLEELEPLLGLAANHQKRLQKHIADPVAKKIYERLDAFEPVPLDCVVADLGLDASVVVAKLVELEAQNLVERKPGQYFVRNPLTTAD